MSRCHSSRSRPSSAPSWPARRLRTDNIWVRLIGDPVREWQQYRTWLGAAVRQPEEIALVVRELSRRLPPHVQLPVVIWDETGIRCFPATAGGIRRWIAFQIELVDHAIGPREAHD